MLSQTLCPNCGAALDTPNKPKTVKCDYCNSTFSYRSDKKEGEEDEEEDDNNTDEDNDTNSTDSSNTGNAGAGLTIVNFLKQGQSEKAVSYAVEYLNYSLPEARKYVQGVARTMGINISRNEEKRGKGWLAAAIFFAVSAIIVLCSLFGNEKKDALSIFIYGPLAYWCFYKYRKANGG